MKQYLVAVQSVDGQPEMSEDEMQKMFTDVDKINDEMQKAGVWVFAGGLLPVESATVVRTENGATTMTDGPFAETREHLAGFWVLKCADLDEALAWATKCSVPCGPIEVRPFDELSQA
jgi:hypothetical protein